MNTSLVCLVLALSSSWNNPATAVSDAVGPSSAIFANSEPYGLYDEILNGIPADSEPVVGTPTSFLAAVPTTAPSNSRRMESLIRRQRDVVIRAQNNVLLADGDSGSPNASPRTYSEAAPLQQVTPYEEPTNSAAPLFTTPPPTGAPYGLAPPPAAPGATTWGANGPQPYRLGYSFWSNVGWIPERAVSPGAGRLGVFEVNMGLNHTIPTWMSPWMFSLEHQFNYRAWDGPKAVDLPGSTYRFGWDMRLETPLNSPYSPWAFSLGFNPSINSDFDQSLTREAINFDGRGIVYFQADPTLLVAVGAGFWDRVHDYTIPYAGVVWTPDSRWEIRAMFPESRISVYMGNVMGEDVWFYLNGEYHIESYQIGSNVTSSGQDQVEMKDWRVVFGCRKSTPVASGFFEAGWVLGRKVDFRSNSAADFDVATGFISRIGVRF